MKTLIATAALVTALASPSMALSPQANLGSTDAVNAVVRQGNTLSTEPMLVRDHYYARRHWSRGGYGNAWCQGRRDPRDPYICNYMGHYN